MKHLRTFALLLVTIAACQTPDAVTPVDTFYRLRFNYASAQPEYSPTLQPGNPVITATDTASTHAAYRGLTIDQNEIHLFVTANTDLDNLVIEKSADGKTWYSYKKVGSLPGYGLVKLSLIK